MLLHSSVLFVFTINISTCLTINSHIDETFNCRYTILLSNLAASKNKKALMEFEPTLYCIAVALTLTLTY